MTPTETVDKYGASWWRLPNGQLHHDGGPALIKPDGFESWYRHGELHREGGPAVVRPSGICEWRQYGHRHRLDGPAIVHTRPLVAGEHSEEFRNHLSWRILENDWQPWFFEGYIVDLGNPPNLGRETPIPGPVPNIEISPNLESDSDVRMLMQAKRATSLELLQHPKRTVVVVAAWHLPFDEKMLDVAFHDSLVRRVVLNRADVSDDAKTFLQVAA